MTVESALIDLRVASHRLVATIEDLQRIIKLSRGDWIREARRAYSAADIALGDAHIELEDAVRAQLKITGRWICDDVA